MKATGSSLSALRRFVITLGLLALGVFSASAQFNISPLATFGNNGWLAPNGYNGSTYPYLTTSGTERGLAYGNGHLYLVSRNGGNSIRILSPTTGAELGQLSGVPEGWFAVNMIAVASDGAIYAANLSSYGTNYTVYRWANETAMPTIAFSGTLISGVRVGDSFSAFGSGSATRLATGFAAISNTNNFALLDPTLGTATVVSWPRGSGPIIGAYDRSMSFIDDTNLLSGGTGLGTFYTRFSGGQWTCQYRLPTIQGDNYLIGCARVGGVRLAAIMSNPTVNISDLGDLGSFSAVPLGNTNLTHGTFPTAYNTGQIAWGKIEGNTAQLYAMWANSGIQAFTVTVGPRLNIVLTASNAQITWPTGYPDFHLEATTNLLVGAGWLLKPTTTNSYTAPLSDQASFFRLVK